MIYLETSAFLKLYFLEKESEEVQALLMQQDEPIPVWDILEGELLNAFQLRVFREEISPITAEELTFLYWKRKRKGQYHTPKIDRLMLMKLFQELSLHTSMIGCRVLDIFHVAFAVQIQPTLFVSYEPAQRELAKEAGLQVFPEVIV
jgi:predicted nucleic acid-binding protein